MKKIYFLLFLFVFLIVSFFVGIFSELNIETASAAVSPSGSVRSQRVDSNLSTINAPAGTQTQIDSPGSTSTRFSTNPYDQSGLTVGNHTVYASNLSGYTIKAGICTYVEGGTPCYVSNLASYTITPTCSGEMCSVPISVTDKNVTKVVFKYDSLPKGSVSILRVGASPVIDVAPSNTRSKVDNKTATYSNPNEVSNLSVGSHISYVTNLSGYSIKAAVCTYNEGDSPCRLPLSSSYTITPTCSGDWCSISTTVQKGKVTKVAFKYGEAGATAFISTTSSTTIDWQKDQGLNGYGSWSHWVKVDWSVSGVGYCSLRYNGTSSSGGYYEATMPMNFSVPNSRSITRGSSMVDIPNIPNIVLQLHCYNTSNPNYAVQLVKSNPIIITVIDNVGSDRNMIKVERVGGDLTRSTAPLAQTSVGFIPADPSSSNFLTQNNPNTWTINSSSGISIYAEDLQGYTVTSGLCYYPIGGSECFPSPTTPVVPSGYTRPLHVSDTKGFRYQVCGFNDSVGKRLCTNYIYPIGGLIAKVVFKYNPIEFTSSSNIVNYGERAVLNWKDNDSEYCYSLERSAYAGYEGSNWYNGGEYGNLDTFGAGFHTNNATSGSTTTEPLTETKTFWLECDTRGDLLAAQKDPGWFNWTYIFRDSNAKIKSTTVTVRPQNPNVCVSANTLGDTQKETINTTHLQDKLADKGFIYNVSNDQKNYQVWNTTGNKATFRITPLGGGTDASNAFGYYFNNDVNTFVPVFQVKSDAYPNIPNKRYPTIPYVNINNTTTFEVTDRDNVGFGINSYFPGLNREVFWLTQNNLNYNTEDHVVAFDYPEGYILGFEDVNFANSDRDYNDALAKIQASDCVVDICRNIDGNQTTIPVGMVKDADGNCVQSLVTADLVATPTTVTSGGYSNLSWTSKNATYCVGSGFSTGSGDPISGGPVSTGRLTFDKTYSVTCVGPLGSATDSVTVSVTNISCTPPKVLKDGVCIDPPVCVLPKVIVNGVCVDPPETPLTCGVTPTKAKVNESVTFWASGAGPLYSWSGSVTDTTQTVSKVFTTSGLKSATVTSSGSSCTAKINIVKPNWWEI